VIAGTATVQWPVARTTRPLRDLSDFARQVESAMRIDVIRRPAARGAPIAS
jgi:hypothetical protein